MCQFCPLFCLGTNSGWPQAGTSGKKRSASVQDAAPQRKKKSCGLCGEIGTSYISTSPS